MKNPIGFGLAIVATATLAAAHGEGDGKNGKDSPLLDNLFQQGTKVSYKPGGGVVFDGGEEFRMNIRGRVQIFWQYVDYDQDTGLSDINTFGLRRARTNFRGHVFSEDVTYFLQMEHSDGTSVLDATMGWRFMNNDDSSMNLRLGLQKLRGSLQWSNSSSRLELPERSAATNTFSGRRGAGALLEGQLLKEDGVGKLTWAASAFNNETANGANPVAPTAPNESVALNYGLHLMYNSEGGSSERHGEGDLDHSGELGWLAGGNLIFGNDRAGGVKDESGTLNLFAGIKTGGGIAAQGEFWARSDKNATAGGNTDDSTGYYLQASYTTAPGEGTQYGFAGRFGMVDLENTNGVGLIARGSGALMSAPLIGLTDGKVTDASLGVSAYYHKHLLKTQLAYTYMKVEPTGGTDTTDQGIQAMFTLLF